MIDTKCVRYSLSFQTQISEQDCDSIDKPKSLDVVSCFVRRIREVASLFCEATFRMMCIV